MLKTRLLEVLCAKVRKQKLFATVVAILQAIEVGRRKSLSAGSTAPSRSQYPFRADIPRFTPPFSQPRIWNQRDSDSWVSLNERTLSRTRYRLNISYCSARRLANIGVVVADPDAPGVAEALASASVEVLIAHEE